jgi:hypothetical protein
MEGGVGWGLPLGVFGEFEEPHPAKHKPRQRVTNRLPAGNAKGVRVTERSKTQSGVLGSAARGAIYKGYLAGRHNFIWTKGQFRNSNQGEALAGAAKGTGQ